MPHNLPHTEAEIDEFLRAFEAGTLAKERWTHAAHLLGGACYVHEMGEARALDHVRTRIKHFNESVGGKNTETSGYHETITAFWVKVIAAFRRLHPEMPRAEFAHLVVETFADKKAYFRDFYDFDVVESRDARREWIAPTLKSL